MSLTGQLNTLESTGLIRFVAAQPELEYLFRHALVQDAAYGSLLKRDRRQLHLAVGEALEQLYPEQRNEQAATLAYHFEKAEDLDKAIHYLSLAGDRARDGYANAEAVVFYQSALGQIEQLLSQANAPLDWYKKQAALFESLADVLELMGQHETARETYDQALTALAQLEEPQPIRQARIYRKIGLVFTVSRQYQEAQQAWDQGEQALSPRPTEQDLTEQTRAYWQEWIEIQVERAWNLYWQFQTGEMDRLCAQIVPVMEQYGTPIQLARVKGVIFLACILRDRYLPSDETLRRGQEALATALAANDFNLIFDGRFGLGFVHLWRREFELAEGPLLESTKLAERSGDAVRTSRCVTYLMMLARMRRQVTETKRFIPRVRELAWAGKMAPYSYTAQACEAWLAWCAGDLAEARALACAALEYLQGPWAAYPIKWLAYLPLLAVAFTEQNLSEAVEYARALLHPTHVRLPDSLTAALEAALVANDQGQAAETQAQLQRALNLAQEMGYL